MTTTKPSMTSQCNYLYGVTPAGATGGLDLVGIEGAKVRAVAHGGLAMIASPIARFRVDEFPPAKILHYLAEHQRVLERVMADAPVIPVKFGTCAEGEDRIVGILESGCGEFTRALNTYAGKVELDLAAFWADLQAVLAELSTDERVVSMKNRIADSPDRSMEQRVRLGQLVKDLLDQRRDALARRLTADLKAIWPNLIVNPTRDDSMVLNAALLVEGREERRFDQVIDELNRRCDNRLNFRCVGPLPPYSFATAEVRAFHPGDLDAARRALQLGPAASLVEIKLAYRRLLQEHHPDRNPLAEAADRVKEIAAAYELLEEYAMNSPHALGGGSQGGLAIVKVKSLNDLRGQCAARAA